ncbi:hypothetical protein MCAMS1_00202 [biofilm metagenome]
MPTNTEGLLEHLTLLFPSFGVYIRNEELGHGGLTYHSIMSSFSYYFSRSSFTEKQLKKLGDFINQSVINEDSIENAISTGFLEHLRQINKYALIAPYLSALAKRKTRA